MVTVIDPTLRKQVQARSQEVQDESERLRDYERNLQTRRSLHNQTLQEQARRKLELANIRKKLAENLLVKRELDRLSRLPTRAEFEAQERARVNALRKEISRARSKGIPSRHLSQEARSFLGSQREWKEMQQDFITKNYGSPFQPYPETKAIPKPSQSTSRTMDLLGGGNYSFGDSSNTLKSSSIFNLPKSKKTNFDLIDWFS